MLVQTIPFYFGEMENIWPTCYLEILLYLARYYIYNTVNDRICSLSTCYQLVFMDFVQSTVLVSSNRAGFSSESGSIFVSTTLR